MQRRHFSALAIVCPAILTSFALSASAESNASTDVTAFGAQLEGFEYPFKTERFKVENQRQSLEMSFMDIAPEKSNGRTVVLLHGKNFCGATREGTINALSEAGYRVIAPDQIGFCKSSKPQSYQFSFHQLAENTKALLDQRGVEKATVVGHSMGACWPLVLL